MERELTKNIMKEALAKDEVLSKSALDDAVHSHIVANSVSPNSINFVKYELGF